VKIMNSPLVECIPNFSEARRPDVITAIVKSISEVNGISILNTSSDLDHNRTVVTFVGSLKPVEEAAFRSIQTAAKLINMDHHTGSHPRLGATDVVPFVPLSGVDIKECVQMAHRLGERVGHELKIPVYLYESAATRPDRVNLEDIRRGQYELLKTEIGSNPNRLPDYGPTKLGTAGATIIGARHPLIAFNVFLSTSEVSIAKEIAKAIRHSSGGFRYVKALGMLVDGMAQVSMNLTNFHQTPIHRVIEAIRREAVNFGVTIHHSELIGLIPGEALQEAAAWYLQLNDFNPAQVLENRLGEENSVSSSNHDFLQAIAAGTPTPGGGSAAAYTGALAASLVAMVCRLTIGKKKYEAVEPEMQEILTQAEILRNDLSRSVTEDALAFESIMAALKLPKEIEDQRRIRAEALEISTLKATQEPLKTVEMVVKILSLAERCVSIGNINAITDSATAFSLGYASLRSAGYNVRINLKNISNKALGETILNHLINLEENAEKITTIIRKSLQVRGDLLL
jgi:glutamate formiminotransferase / formiminotetrahydrofolate cyclodeaminase